MPTTRSRQKQSSSAHDDAKSATLSVAVRPRKTSRSKMKASGDAGPSSDMTENVHSDAPSAAESTDDTPELLPSHLPSDMGSSSMMISSDPPLDSLPPSSDPAYMDVEDECERKHNAFAGPAPHQDEVSRLRSALQSRNAEILASRSLLRRFARSLSKTVTTESAPPGTFGKVARTSGIFGRFSIGASDTREADGTALAAIDESSATAFDCTNGSALLQSGETSFHHKLTDDVDDLCVLLSEATQRYDFLRLEDNLQKQRLQKELDGLKARYGRVSSPKSPGSPASTAHDKALDKLKQQIEEMRSNSKVLAEEYAQKNQSQQDQIDELINTLEEQDQELDNLKQRAQATESQLQLSKEQHDKLIEEERAVSASILQALTVEMDKLKVQTSRLQEEKRLAEKAVELSTEEAAKQEKEKGALNSRIEEMERLIQESEERRDHLKELKEQAVQAKDVESQQSQQEVEQLRQELDKAKAAQQQEGNKHAHQLQEQISKTSILQDEVEKKEKELAFSQEQLASKEEALQIVRDEFEEMSRNFHHLEEDDEKLQNELVALRDQVAEHSEASVSAQTKISQLQGRIVELEQALDEANAQGTKVNELQAQVTDLQLEVSAGKARAEELIQTSDSAQATIDQLQGKVKELEQSLQHADAQDTKVSQLQAQVANLQLEISASNARAEDRIQASVSAQAMIAQLQGKVKELEQALEKADVRSAQVDGLQAQIADLQLEISTSNARAEDRIQASVSAQAMISKLQDRVKELEQALEEAKHQNSRTDDLQAQVADLQLEISASKARAAEAVSAQMSACHAEEKGKLQARIEEVEQRLRTAEERAAQLDDLENQLRKERAHHEQRSETLQEDFEKARQKAQDQFHEQTERLSGATLRCSSLEAEVKRKEADLAAMRTQLAADNELLQEAHDERERIAERLEAVKVERDSFRNQMSRLEEQMARSRASSESSRGNLSQLQEHVNRLESQLAKAKQGADRAEDLQAQIIQLEEELSRKSEEIEENDTKTLAFMKERKRLELRVKKLQDKVEQLSRSPTSPGSDALQSATTVSPTGSSGERVRSPLAVSNIVNVPTALGEHVARPARSASATVPSTQSATSSKVQREAKPPTPWSVAVALSSNHPSRQVSDGLKKTRSSSETVAVTASTQHTSQTKPVERSRKRSSPDDVAEALRARGEGGTSATAPVTRPVYVPSPRKSGFVPQRRSKTNLAAAARESVGSSAPIPAVPATRVPSNQLQQAASHQNGATPKYEPALTKKPSHSYLSATKSSSSHLATKMSQTNLTAAERLAGRLRNEEPVSSARVRSGTGSTFGTGGGGLSAQLAEVRARRAQVQQPDY